LTKGMKSPDFQLISFYPGVEALIGNFVS